MQITLCNFSKRMNSTKQPSADVLAAGKTFNDVALKELTNIDNPKLILAGASTNDYAYNYAYIHDWGRYYHIKSADLRHKDIYHVSLELDDLATYKTQILATSAYVIYSSSDFNRWIKDDRCPILIHGSEYVYSSSAILVDGEPLFTYSNDEAIVITTVSESFGIWSWVLSESELEHVMGHIFSDDDIISALTKQFGDMMGSIVQVIRLPINPDILKDSHDTPISFGSVSNGTDEEYPWLATKHIRARGTISMPITYTDYRYTEPYCQGTLTIPFIGSIDFPLSILSDGSVNWQLDLDVLTGTCTYTLYDTASENNIITPIATYSGQCGGIVPIANLQVQNITNTVKGMVGGLVGSGLVMGANPTAGIVGGVASIVGGFFGFSQKQANVIGSYSGGRSEFAQRQIRLVVEKFHTANEPNNLTDIEGRPLCMVRTLSGLTGYVRTQGFSIDLAANSDVIKSINSKLDAGIYIE